MKSYEKMLEINLEAHGFGQAPKISEVDFMVFEDDDIRMAHYDAKDARTTRFKNEKNRKERNKALYLRYGKPDVWSSKASMNRDDAVGICPVFAGKDQPVAYVKKGHKFAGYKNLKKAQNRKTRHQKFYKPLPEAPVIDEEDDITDEEFFWELSRWVLGLPDEDDFNLECWLERNSSDANADFQFQSDFYVKVQNVFYEYSKSRRDEAINKMAVIVDILDEFVDYAAVRDGYALDVALGSFAEAAKSVMRHI